MRYIFECEECRTEHIHKSPIVAKDNARICCAYFKKEKPPKLRRL